MKSPRLLLPLLLACFGLSVPCRCQTAFPSTTKLPDTASVQVSPDDPRLMAYDALFCHVMFDERIALQLRSQGKKTSLGSAIRQKYGLSEDQYAQLAAIAIDWGVKFDVINAKAKPFLAQRLTSVTSSALNTMVEEHRQVTRDSIARLQTALGGPAPLANMEAVLMKASQSSPK